MHDPCTRLSVAYVHCLHTAAASISTSSTLVLRSWLTLCVLLRFSSIASGCFGKWAIAGDRATDRYQNSLSCPKCDIPTYRLRRVMYGDISGVGSDLGELAKKQHHSFWVASSQCGTVPVWHRSRMEFVHGVCWLLLNIGSIYYDRSALVPEFQESPLISCISTSLRMHLST